jgi:hypothetical protein
LTRNVAHVVDFGVGTLNSILADASGAIATPVATGLAIETGPAAPVIGVAAGAGTVIGTNLGLSKAYKYYREPLIHGLVTDIRAVEKAYDVTSRALMHSYDVTSASLMHSYNVTTTALSNVYDSTKRLITGH